MWLVEVSGFDLIFDVSVVSLEIGWVHGGGYREAVGGGGGSRRRCGSTSQHGCPAGADGRHGQARGPLQVQVGSVQLGRFFTSAFNLARKKNRWSLLLGMKFYFIV